MMSFHELSRRKLQALCKQHGLPANKSNVVMAASLATFFSEQQTISQAYAQVGTPCTVSRTRLAREKQLEASSTSLAALILGSDSLLRRSKEQVRRPAVSPPEADGALLLKTTPLRRRSKKESSVVRTLPVCDEDGEHGTAPDSAKHLRLPPEETSVHSRKTSSPEPQLLNSHVLITDAQDSTDNLRLLPEERKSSSPHEPELAPDVVVTDDQDPPSTRKHEHMGSVEKEEAASGSGAVASSSEDYGQTMCTVLTSPLLRLTANVDTLIQRATGMLEKFEQWKQVAGNPGLHFLHRSGQKHLAFDKENLYQQSPCKNSKLRSLQGYQMSSQTSDRKEGVLKEARLLNIQT